MAIKIMTDSGHTGKYYNKGAVSGYYESAIMWKLTQMEIEELKKRGFVAGTTRSSIDTEMDVTVRGKKAKGYDFFYSNHSNATDNTTTRRVVCIYQTNDSQGVWDTESRVLADKLAAVIASTMGVTWKNYSKLAGGDRDGDGKKDDNYYGVLHGARMVKVPGIIIEHSFHTNPETCRWLMDDDNLRKLAKAKVDCLAEHFGLVAQEQPSHEKEEPFKEYSVKVTSSNGVNIRKGPGTNYGKNGALAKGSVQIITAEKTGKGAKLWGELKSGKGWIALDYTERVKETEEVKFQSYSAKVKPVNGLNVRSGPSTSYGKLGALGYGKTITILEEKSGWGRIKFNGVTGWVSLTYVKPVK